MVGNYQNKYGRQISFFLSWLQEFDKSDNVFDDIHLDELYTKSCNKENWSETSIELLQIYGELLDKNKYDIVLALVLSCTSYSCMESMIFASKLEWKYDLTPPSFYIFKKGLSNSLSMTLDETRLLPNLSNETLKVFYKELKEGDEYYRTIFVRM